MLLMLSPRSTDLVAGLEPGHVLLGRYQLERPLAQGGMGAVWVGRHLGLDAPVAIKFAHARGAEAGNRLFREARTVAALGSPYIVRVVDVGTRQGVSFLVMELLEGETLRERTMGAMRLTPGQTRIVAAQVTKALSLTHSAEVVHGDLKPSNIFLANQAGEEIVKVLDFGLAHQGEYHGGNSKEILGTPGYLSPEQVLQPGTLSKKTDLWSWALIVFECLTGESPHGRKAISDVLDSIQSEPLPLPSKTVAAPPALDDWFRRATQLDPSLRFSSARDMQDALEKALDQCPAQDERLERLGEPTSGGSEFPRETVTAVPQSRVRRIEPSPRGQSPLSAHSRATPLPPSRVDDEVRFSAWRSVLIAHWHRATTKDGVRELSHRLEQLALRYNRVGLLHVIGSQSLTPDAAARQAMTRCFRTFGPRISFSNTLIEGDDLRAAAVRIVAAGIGSLQTNQFPFYIHRTLEESTRDAAAMLDWSQRERGELLEATQALLRQSESRAD